MEKNIANTFKPYNDSMVFPRDDCYLHWYRGKQILIPWNFDAFSIPLFNKKPIFPSFNLIRNILWRKRPYTTFHINSSHDQKMAKFLYSKEKLYYLLVFKCLFIWQWRWFMERRSMYWTISEMHYQQCSK